MERPPCFGGLPRMVWGGPSNACDLGAHPKVALGSPFGVSPLGGFPPGWLWSCLALRIPPRVALGSPPAVCLLWGFPSGFTRGTPQQCMHFGSSPQGGFGIPLALGVPPGRLSGCLALGVPPVWLWDPPCSGGSLQDIFVCPPRSWQRFGGSLRGAVVPPRFGDTPGMGLSFPPRITPCSGIPPAVFWVPHAVLPLWGLPLCCHRAWLSPPHRHPRRDPRTRSKTRYIHPQRSRGCPSAVSPFPAPSHLAEVRGSGFPSQQIPVLPSSL